MASKPPDSWFYVYRNKSKIQMLRTLHLSAVRGPPLHIVLPAHRALSTLVAAQLDAAAEVLGDAPAPPSFVDGAVYGLDLVPALFGRDLRQVCRGETVLQAIARGQRR